MKTQPPAEAGLQARRATVSKVRGFLLAPLFAIHCNAFEPGLQETVSRLEVLADDPVRVGELNDRIKEIRTAWELLQTELRHRVEAFIGLETGKIPMPQKAFSFNPWLEKDTGPAFLPEFDTIPMKDAGRDLRRFPKDFIRSLIPDTLRLAEYLGLGRNQIFAEASYLEPHIQFGELNGHYIGCRVRQDIFGVFLTETEPMLPEIETFRQSMETRDMVRAAEIRISTEVKPHHYSLRELPIQSDYSDHHNRLWEREKMDERFEMESVGIRPSLQDRKALDAFTDQIKKRIEYKKKEIRERVIRKVIDELPGSVWFQGLRTELDALFALEISLHQQEVGNGSPCGFEPVTEESGSYLIRSAVEIVPGLQSGSMESTLDIQPRLSVLHCLRHLAIDSEKPKAVDLFWRASTSLLKQSNQERFLK